ncbi:Protoheme IX farnesyltransferase, mitochondrial [Elasticomyces elasticus]|uniref:Protoheme IX farnesyltransferase, mitochondrial n=1 Tax=Exophiala sideris TaxID=1016849 RepID=A0ABR0J525_9EURO|nr:Protoheme IX farnesyltransferase, mitochondrial [Elasticomyces elasticus]KAK5034850.1 Protoheme IX farnesyltransferase, mitochondrial [Exophiala sideris]KAK5056415.1 Protoheme IX farnesyltransferase, mitochondrial [Exophiala sideris]KAK5181096.1 Protoheme IX farnesyltransferase, mitochondrial [Eurotiomycetes sp. CCFEE 6388]
MTAPAAVSRLSRYSICFDCLSRVARHATLSDNFLRSSAQAKRKLYTGSLHTNGGPRSTFGNSQKFVRDYFSANTSLERGWVKNGLLAAMRTVAEPQQSGDDVSIRRDRKLRAQEELDKISSDHKEAMIQSREGQQIDLTRQIPQAVQAEPETRSENLLPHRRRKRRKESEGLPDAVEESLPLDASSQLTTAAAAMPTSATIRRRMATYLSLSKPRLSFLILLSTTSAYSLYPIPELLSSTASSVESTLSTSTLTLLFLTSGTFLSCACANTLNMLFEPQYDALMTRTRNRPLVRNLISKRGASVFALLCGASGLLLLGYGTNPTVAGLSALNIFLYAGVYTPMKRISAANTWVGAIVGGIPPLMGWCAAAGEVATSEHHSWQDLLFSEDSVGGWALAALLFAWQFPHFMSLSHTIRDDYRNAGHKMLAWTNPARNARVALRYSIAMFPIFISTACNVWMTREAVRFWRKQGAGGSARGLFWASVWQLPLVLVGALVCKKGLWDGFFGTGESASIYDESEVEYEGDRLGMEPANQSSTPPGNASMPVLALKKAA